MACEVFKPIKGNMKNVERSRTKMGADDKEDKEIFLRVSSSRGQKKVLDQRLNATLIFGVRVSKSLHYTLCQNNTSNGDL